VIEELDSIKQHVKHPRTSPIMDENTGDPQSIEAEAALLSAR